jgi:hypothetical protein
MMEAVRTSETSEHHTRRRENLQSNIIFIACSYKIQFLAYFSKMKVGLSNHKSVCPSRKLIIHVNASVAAGVPTPCC